MTTSATKTAEPNAGKCAALHAMWNEAGQGEPLPRGFMLELGIAQGFNPSTVRTQAQRWLSAGSAASSSPLPSSDQVRLAAASTARGAWLDPSISRIKRMQSITARVGRLVIADAFTSAPLADFDYTIKSTFTSVEEAAEYQDVFAWAWHLVPQLLDQGTRFSLFLEEALPGGAGRVADYIPVYAAERLSAASRCEFLTRKRRRAELMTRTRPLHPPVRLVMHAA